MRFFILSLTLKACLALFPEASAAQNLTPPTETPSIISLNAACSLAAKESMEVILAEYALKEAASYLVGAGIIVPTNPKILTEGRRNLHQSTPNTLPNLGYLASIEWPLELNGAPAARVQEAQTRVKIAEKALSLAKFEAYYQTWHLYRELQLLDLKIKELTEIIAIAQRIHQACHLQVQEGSASMLAEHAATASLAEYEALKAATLATQADLQRQFKQLLGWPALTNFTLTSAFKPLPHCFTEQLAGPDLTTFTAELSVKRPDLALIQSRLTFLSALSTRLHREALPKIGLSAGLDVDPGAPAYGQLGLSVDLPLFQRNQGPKALAAATYATEHKRLELETQRLARLLVGLRASCLARREEASILSDKALPAAQQTLQLVEAGFLAGRFDIFRLTTAMRDLARLRLQRLEVLSTTWREHITLAAALTGELDEP